MENTDSYVLHVAQKWRGEDSMGKRLPLHWALTIKTAGSDIGNIYNAAGNIDTFHYEALTNTPLKDVNYRGSLLVGTIPRESLPEVEQLLSQVPVIRHDYNWNCQNWVWSGIRELRKAGYPIKPFMTWHELVIDMDRLVDDWEE